MKAAVRGVFYVEKVEEVEVAEGVGILVDRGRKWGHGEGEGAEDLSS